MNDLPYLMAAWIAEMEIRFPANKDPKVVTSLLETITIYRKGLFYWSNKMKAKKYHAPQEIYY